MSRWSSRSALAAGERILDLGDCRLEAQPRDGRMLCGVMASWGTGTGASDADRRGRMTVFRDNLYIDKNHSIFLGPLFVGRDGRPTKKAMDLASPRSEDAVTWSVFRTLLRIAPCRWLGSFVDPGVTVSIADDAMVGMEIDYIRFWPHIPAPRSRLQWLWNHRRDPRVQGSCGARDDPQRLQGMEQQAQGGEIPVLEGETELDALMDHPEFLVAVEAKHTADLAHETTWDLERDQLGRVIDIAIELSLQHGKPCFVVLVTDRRSHDPPKLYEQLVPRYQADRDFLRERLPHRSLDELVRLRGVGWITWQEILQGVDQEGLSECERQLLCGLTDYLRHRGLC